MAAELGSVGPYYLFTEKNTFLEIRMLEDVPTHVRKSSWSAGENQTPRLLAELDAPNEQHSRGQCQPCVFFASRQGCTSTGCSFCHLAHSKKVNHRPQKAIRDQMKKAMEEVLEVSDPEARRLAMQKLAAQHDYMRRVVIGFLDAMTFECDVLV